MDEIKIFKDTKIQLKEMPLNELQAISKNGEDQYGVTTVLKWVSGGLEALWGFPLIGGLLIVSLYWTPLLFMFSYSWFSFISKV